MNKNDKLDVFQAGLSKLQTVYTYNLPGGNDEFKVKCNEERKNKWLLIELIGGFRFMNLV